jgi:hypothetical protein
MKKKDRRGNAGRGISFPNDFDSAAVVGILVSYRVVMREVSHGRA